MGRRAGIGICALGAALGLAAPPADAGSERVLVLRDHRVHVKREQFLGRTELSTGRSAAPRKRVATAAAKRAPRGRALRKGLGDLLAAGQIDQATHDARQADLRAVL